MNLVRIIGGSTGDRLCNHQQVDPLGRKSRGGGVHFYGPKGLGGEGSQQWFEIFVYWKSDSHLNNNTSALIQFESLSQVTQSVCIFISELLWESIQSCLLIFSEPEITFESSFNIWVCTLLIIVMHFMWIYKIPLDSIENHIYVELNFPPNQFNQFVELNNNLFLMFTILLSWYPFLHKVKVR